MQTFSIAFNTSVPPVAVLWGRKDALRPINFFPGPRDLAGLWAGMVKIVETARMENLLEPLGCVYGVDEPKVVCAAVDEKALDIVRNPSGEFVEKLEGAMRSKVLRCTPLEPVIRKRVVKRKGRKQVQEYRVGRYWDSKFWFEVAE